MRSPKIARTIVWEVAATQARARCFMQPGPEGIELIVLADTEQVKREVCRGPEHARSRADELKARLVSRGWREVPR